MTELPATRRLPALARVALYLLAWGALMLFATVTVVVAVTVPLLNSGGTTADAERLLLPNRDQLPPLGVVAFTTYLELGVTLLVTALFMRCVERRAFRTLGFELPRRPGMPWLAGFAIEGTHFAVLFAVGAAAGWYQIMSVAPPLRSLQVLGVGFLILLPAAVLEEVSIRGYVLQTLAARYGAGPALVVSSGAFALLHAFNPDGRRPLSMIGLFAAGLYLGAAYLATRKLWLPIAMHVAWNLFEGPVFGLPVSGMMMPDSVLRVRTGGPEWLTGGAFGPEAGTLVLLTTALFAPVVWGVGRRLADPAEPD